MQFLCKDILILQINKFVQMHNIMINSQNQGKLRTATHRLSSLTSFQIFLDIPRLSQTFQDPFQTFQDFLDFSRPFKTILDPYQGKHTNLQKVLKWSLELSNQDHRGSFQDKFSDFFKIFKRSYVFLYVLHEHQEQLIQVWGLLPRGKCLNYNNY